MSVVDQDRELRRLFVAFLLVVGAGPIMAWSLVILTLGSLPVWLAFVSVTPFSMVGGWILFRIKKGGCA